MSTYGRRCAREGSDNVVSLSPPPSQVLASEIKQMWKSEAYIVMLLHAYYFCIMACSKYLWTEIVSVYSEHFGI